MLRACFVSVCAAACAMAGQAEELVMEPVPVRDPGMVITNITLDDLRLLLDDRGAVFLAAGKNDTGAPFVFARAHGGATMGVYTICADEAALDCRGVEFMAAFNSRVPAERISEIDQSYGAISVYKADEQTVHVSRYVILDYGITWANLLENASVFEALCGKVLEQLVAAEGPPDKP